MAPRFSDTENSLIYNISLEFGDRFPLDTDPVYREFLAMRGQLNLPVRTRSAYVRQFRILRYTENELPDTTSVPVIVTREESEGNIVGSLKRRINDIYEDDDIDELIESLHDRKRRLDKPPCCSQCNKSSKDVVVYSCKHPLCLTCFVQLSTKPLPDMNTRCYECPMCERAFTQPAEVKFVTNATERNIRN